MHDVSSVPPNQAIRRLDTAFQNFFNKHARKTRFKKKANRQSATFTNFEL